MSKLSICHFNDVYRVTPQKVSPTSSETIDVTQFAAMLDGIREQWPERADGKRDGEFALVDVTETLSDHSFNRACIIFWGCVFTLYRELSLQRKSYGMYPLSSIITHFILLPRYP